MDPLEAQFISDLNELTEQTTLVGYLNLRANQLQTPNANRNYERARRKQEKLETKFKRTYGPYITDNPPKEYPPRF